LLVAASLPSCGVYYEQPSVSLCLLKFADSSQGYDHDHKDIELLRLRNFTMGRKLTDDEIVGVGGLERVGELVANMVPFVSLTIRILDIDGIKRSLNSRS
jgi:hypothetical protein